MADGWIKVHRKLASSSTWLSEGFTRGQAWVDLLMLANYADGFVRIRGVKVPLSRGQLGHAVRFYCDRWAWSKGKVQRFFDELETSQQIVQQKTNVTTVLTITNYDDYQGDGSANESANGTQTGHRQASKRDTDRSANGTNKKKNNNKKKKGEEKEGGGSARFTPPTVCEVRDYCQERGNAVDPERFVDYYQAQGWKLANGRAMKDWRAAVRSTWEKNQSNGQAASDPRGNLALLDRLMEDEAE